MRGLVAVLAAVLAAPAAADDCAAFWALLTEPDAVMPTVSGQLAAAEADWCVIEDLKLDLPGEYVPDWHADRLRVRGSFLPWMTAFLTTGSTGGLLPDRLEATVEGLRAVMQSGSPQMDYIFAAQARANTIDADLALAWNAATRVLTLEKLAVDFPGENALSLSAVAKGVDLSSLGAMQMSATGFSVTEVDLQVVSFGLFEWYLLMPLGASLLPSDGDMDAAVAGLRADAEAGIAALPEATFAAPSKAALRALLADLPNPAGELTVSMRSEAGVGPARLAGYAVTGMPFNMMDAARLFDGATIDIGWTNADAP